MGLSKISTLKHKIIKLISKFNISDEGINLDCCSGKVRPRAESYVMRFHLCNRVGVQGRPDFAQENGVKSYLAPNQSGTQSSTIGK